MSTEMIRTRLPADLRYRRRAVGRRGTRMPGFELLESRLVPAAQPLITEFVADNEEGIQDEDGNRSDWLELYNAGDESLDLAGWHLTDDPRDLQKWTFPSATLDPGQYLLVWASGKDRAASGSPLHTNFRLDAGGDHLALVLPDGTTVAQSFAPEFPAQTTDVSYGVAQSSDVRLEVAERADVRWFVPTVANGGDQLGKQWRGTGFDDSAWNHGESGIGYDQFSRLDHLIGSNLQSSMYQVNRSVYARFPLLVSDPRAVFSLQLSVQYSGGFVAYLNGEEIARRGAPENVQWDSGATGRRSSLEIEMPESIDLTSHRDLLESGENILAFQGLNSDIRSSAFLLRPLLSLGRPAPIASLEYGYVAEPAPEAPNGERIHRGVLGPVEVSTARGFFEAPFELELAAADPDTTLVYTLDGSEPTPENGVQVSPSVEGTAPGTRLSIANTTTLRAAVFREGFLPAASSTHTYFFLDDAVSQSFDDAIERGFPDTWQSEFGAVTLPDYSMDSDVVGPDDRFGGEFAAEIYDALRTAPSLSIVLDNDDMFSTRGIYSNPTRTGFDWERPTSVELVYPDGRPGFQVNAGLRIQGGFTRESNITLKHSLRLEFRRQYGPAELRFPLFGDSAVDRLDTVILRTNGDDGWQWAGAGPQPQYIRDEWGRVTQQAMGHASPHGTFLHVFINGLYWGLYNAVERPEGSFSASYYGGDDDEWDALNSGREIDGTNESWLQLLDLAKQADVPAQQRLSNRIFQQMMGNFPDGSDSPEYETLLDVENMIDYMLLNFYAGNTDWPHKNWYVARRRGPESTGFKFYSWDSEWTLNLRSGVNVNVVGSRSGIAEPFQRLRANNEFRRMVADRIQKHFFNGGVFYVDPEHPELDADHPERNQPAARYVALAEQVETALIAESARWGDQHRTDLPYTLREWRAERDHVLQNYFPRRSANVLQQLIDAGLYPHLEAPRLSQHGGAVTADFRLAIDGPGEIYYTLDGTDPRQNTFGPGRVEPIVAPTAVRYSGAFPVDQAVRVKVRSFQDGQWSALVEADFTTGVPPVRISEIMYHPAAAPAGSPYDDEDFEFIELVNVSPSLPVDLGGMRLTDAVEFTFPAMELLPGQRVLVVRNAAAVASRYGTGLRVAGEYGPGEGDWKLSNRGELVRLRDAAGTIVQQFTYRSDWHAETDGDGKSLEAADELRGGGDWNAPAAWRASIAGGGTPGRGRGDVTVPTGDLNLDGLVDFRDLADLVLALGDMESYRARHAVDSWQAGDADSDGDLDFDDLNALAALLAAPGEG